MAQHGKRLDKSQQNVLLQSFEENSDEAWGQIKSFMKKALCVLLALAAVGLIAAAIYFVPIVYPLISSMRAPELVPAQAVEVEPAERTEGEVLAPPEEDVFDESTTEQPLLSGARKENYYTFLLFGTDKEGTNTDTIMVVSYDVGNQKLNLMSIPRDTMVNVGWDIKKINSVYGMRGLGGFKKQIAKLIGFTPDFYVKIDLQAFVDVVDLIGGVEFDVPIPMHYHDPYQDLSIDLEPGLQTLNGEQAMGLVRFRKSDRGNSGKITGYDDTGRVQTQQAFLKEMYKKCVKLTNWTKISSYVEIFENNVESDLTLGNMLWFARQAMELSEDGFVTVTAPGNYYASAYSRSTGGMQSYATLYGREMVRLVNESFNPYLTKVSMSNLDIMGVNPDGSVYSSTGHVVDSAAALPVKQEEEGDAEEPEQPDEKMPEDAEAPFDPTEEPPDEEGGEPEEPEPPAEDEPPPEDEPPEDGGASEEPPPEPEPAPAPEPEPTPEPTTTDTTPTESGDQ